MTPTTRSYSHCNDNFTNEAQRNEERTPQPKKFNVQRLRRDEDVGPVEMIVKSSRSESDDISLNLQ